MHPAESVLDIIDVAIDEEVDASDRADVRALIIEALSLLDDGRLVRYGLRPSELAKWQEAQKR